MGISAHIAGYGPPAEERLAATIRELKHGEPLRAVTVVVPANSVGVSIRRAFGRGTLRGCDAGVGIVGMTFLTVYRLGELLGASSLAEHGRRPATTPIIAAAFRRELAADPGVFDKVADHPATEESLIRVHAELSDCTPEALDRLATQSRRAGDVVALHRRVRERLMPDWYEEADLLDAAGAAVRDGTSLVDDLGAVVVYLPQDLTPAGAGLLRALADRTEVVVVGGATGVATADADLERSLRRLGIDAVVPQIDLPRADAIISVSDPEEEVRLAIDHVIEAARAGIPFDRMAVLYPHRAPYARLVDDAFAAAEVPRNGLAVRPLTEHLAGRWLLDVLALPERDYARAAVMSLLAEAPVQTSDGQRVAVTAWQRLSREAGVVHSAEAWRTRPRALARAFRVRAEREDEGEGREWLSRRWRSEADEADRLAGFVDDLIQRVEAAQTMTTWAQFTDWARGVLHHYLGDEQRRQRWPEEEADAANRVEAALDRLAGLDTIDPTADLDVFRRTLELELDSDLARHNQLGHGVLTGLPSMALGVDLDLVVMLGLAEGVAPPRVRQDSLLADHEREVVGDQLAPRSRRTPTMQRQVLAALASADRRVLVWPRGDLRRSTERSPSRWLLDLCEAQTSVREVRGDMVTTVASFAARVADIAFPATDQEHALRTLGDGIVTPDELGRQDPRFGRGTQLWRARRGIDFTRFDGNLAHVADDLPPTVAPEGRVFSVSRLQDYVTCPHSYFARQILRVQEVEDPEARVDISPLDKGSLVHTVLEDWLLEQLDAGVPRPSEPWSPSARKRLLEVAAATFDDFEERGATGHPAMWAYDRRVLAEEFVRFLDEDDRLRAEHQLTPVAAEQSFGPVTLDLGDAAIQVAGKIDRVDQRADGALVLTDYKTGSGRDLNKLTPEQPDLDGKQLQLLLYAAAVRAERKDDSLPVHARYWLVSNNRKTDIVGYDVTEPMLERLRYCLRVIVDGLSGGRFPQVPEDMNRWVSWVPCPYCEPDGLGTADAYRRWERLRGHPDLRTYLRLAHPDVAQTLDQAEEGSA